MWQVLVTRAHCPLKRERPEGIWLSGDISAHLSGCTCASPQALLQNQSRCPGPQAQSRPQAAEGVVAGSSPVRRATADPCTPPTPGEVRPKASAPKRVGMLGAAGKAGLGVVPFRSPSSHAGPVLAGIAPWAPCPSSWGPCGSACPPYLLLGLTSETKLARTQSPGPHFPASLHVQTTEGWESAPPRAEALPSRRGGGAWGGSPCGGLGAGSSYGPSELPPLATPASPEPTFSAPRMESRLLSSLLWGAPSTAHAGTSPARTQEKCPTVPSIPVAHSSGICSGSRMATSAVKVSL